MRLQLVEPDRQDVMRLQRGESELMRLPLVEPEVSRLKVVLALLRCAAICRFSAARARISTTRPGSPSMAANRAACFSSVVAQVSSGPGFALSRCHAVSNRVYAFR